MEPTQHYIDVAGGRLSVLSLGEGAAVLFLHGWALDQRMWRKQYELAEKGFRVVTVDRRGFGASSAPPDLNLELEDITSILDALCIDGVALVGMSQGGRIALRYAMATAERLSRLVLQGAPIDGFPSMPPTVEAVPLARFRQYMAEGNRPAFLQEWLAHDLVRYDRELEPELIGGLVEAYEGRDLLRAPADRFNQDVFSSLASLALPSLYIAGEHDTSWLKMVATTFGKLVPNGHAEFISGAGHLCNISRPQAYNKLLAEFLWA